MHLRYRNVNEAFSELVYLIHQKTIPVTIKESRVGQVMQVDEPVLITYSHPKERVLFNAARDANPFFHLYEALWMLAGRHDVAPLAYYNSKIADIASDDGLTFNGAYGYRWRHAMGLNPKLMVYHNIIDQLQLLINHLRESPNSRRAVLQMWNVQDDLLKVDKTKDVCCNTQIYFAIRGELANFSSTLGDPNNYYLDMTVMNRSNDMILGMLGANYVHFTILQEYMAAHLGVEVGKYHHFTNNLHVYTNNWKPEKWLETENSKDFYYTENARIVPTRELDLREIQKFVSVYDHQNQHNRIYESESAFLTMFSRLMQAYRYHKVRDYDTAHKTLSIICDTDWGIVAERWISNREQMYQKKVGGE